MFYIKDASEYIGKEVKIRGWLYNKRSSGSIKFLLIRDGTGIMQGIMIESELDPQVFSKFDDLTQESSLKVTGTIREDKRAPGGYEITIKDVEIYQIADEYPITPKSHGTNFLLDHRHLWIRSKLQNAILNVRSELIQAIRDYFYQNGFAMVDSPILTKAIGEEAATLFETDYFDLGKASLAQTGQLYAEAAIFSLNKVYTFGPTFRAEKSKTRRHLIEFWMIEGEEAFYDNEMNMDLQEDLVEYFVQRVVERAHQHLETLERDISALEKVRKPFYRISYDECVEILKKNGSPIEWGQDLGGEDQTILSTHYDKPVFIYNFPKHAKAFYMKEHPENPDLVLCSDLFAPEGHGEIIGGSQREDDYDKLLNRIREEGLPEEAYGWYLDLRKYGSVPHSGFGLGLERTVGWVCGIEHVREAIPFPRLINRIYP
ncbi:asparagine--tRNA ligase [bacterium]|nr:asparagine--tRNA ligase [bacterium]